MIGIVIVTHGRLAAEFLSATEHIVGPQTHVNTICIGPNDDIERLTLRGEQLTRFLVDYYCPEL